MSTTYDGIPSNLSGTLPTAVSINATTNASPIVVTTGTPHGCVTGDLVQVNGHLVNTPANGLWTVTVSSPTVLSLVGSTGSASGSATGTLINLGYGAAYQIPSDGDPKLAASVNVGLEALGDRTALLAANIGTYALLGIVGGPVDPTTPFSSNTWGSISLTTANDWELITTTPATVFTKADFFNAGDLLDISLDLSCTATSSTTDYAYLGLCYAWRASSTASAGTKTYLPGSGKCIGNLLAAPNISACMTLSGQLIVPAHKTTIDLFVYAMSELGSGCDVDLLGPYNPAIRIYRPTGFRPSWP
jgi:hypothetical protein